MKLYVAMVGLPARGKSTLAKRIMAGLSQQGIRTSIFNNGELRRKLHGTASSVAEFFNASNETARHMREQIAMQNMQRARSWLQAGGDVAIIDATHGSLHQRNVLTEVLNDFPVLFIECINNDPLLLAASIQRKTKLPEFAWLSEEEASKQFYKRIAYYENVYEPLKRERCWIRVDAVDNRIQAEAPSNDLPYYAAIRDIVSTRWVQNLYLVRHGESEYNTENRIGGDSPLTGKGQEQALDLARHFEGVDIPFIFLSSKCRSRQMAVPLLKSRPQCVCKVLDEFDEIDAGICEGMSYNEIRESMPLEYEARKRNKFSYVYPKGESYAMLKTRVARGLRRALFLSGEDSVMIVGHQAINRVILSLFLFQRDQDVPYIYIPQNQYYHISVTQRKKVFEMVPYS